MDRTEAEPEARGLEHSAAMALERDSLAVAHARAVEWEKPDRIVEDPARSAAVDAALGHPVDFRVIVSATASQTPAQAKISSAVFLGCRPITVSTT